MKTKNIVPNKLLERRKYLGFTQRQVANMLGFVSEDRISHWEKGVAVPHLVNLFRLSKLYGVLPQELYPELLEASTDRNMG
jgi:transcriptional regulator with XRE-family HTH domain